MNGVLDTRSGYRKTVLYYASKEFVCHEKGHCQEMTSRLVSFSSGLRATLLIVKHLGNEYFVMSPKEGLFQDKLLLGVDSFRLMSVIIENSRMSLCIGSLEVD